MKLKTGCRHDIFTPRWRWRNEDRALISYIIKDLQKPIVHVCSGSSSIGDIRVDFCPIKLKPRNRWDNQILGSPNIIADMCRLPLKSEIAGTVICDPPYDYKYQDQKSDDPLICELVRILRPGGSLIFFAPWVYTHPDLELLKITPSRVGQNRFYFKLLQESVKLF